MATTSEQRSIVVGAFEDRHQADAAIGELRQGGFREDQIAVEEARYDGGSGSDRTTVTVTAEGRYDEATALLRRHGAYDLRTTAHASRTAEGAERIQVREEELQAHTRRVETGAVRVRKEVVTEHRTIEVPVRREEVVIERHAPTGEPAAADIRPGEEIRIPVTKEQVTVEKRPVVKEEVTVGKRVVEGTETVGGEVRREEVRVEREGDADVPASPSTGQITANSGAAAPTSRATEEDEEAEIRRRAYLKWRGEGCPSGQDLHHYFEASREVRA